MKKVFFAIGGLLLFIIFIFSIAMFDLQWRRFFNPKYENVRREVYESTQSYVHGKAKDLPRYKHEWDKADPDEKLAIESVIRQQFAEFDETKLQSDGLKTFLIKVRGF